MSDLDWKQGQRLDVNALLSARMEQVERAEKAEAEVERLNRIISESKPWIAMADELADAQAAIQRVRKFCVEILKDYDAADTIISIADILDLLDGDSDE